MMVLKSETRQIQQGLASYCRTGQQVELPGVTPNRLHHYRRLIFNVVKNTLDAAYPISLEYFGETKWEELVDMFFKNHNPQTPQVWRMPGEFYQWAVDISLGERLGLPWLEDLLLVEWAELDVHTMPDGEIGAVTEKGKWLDGYLVVNPDYQLLKLSYPVHKIPLHQITKSEGPLFLLLFREPETGRVRFLDLSVLFAFVFENIALNGQSMRQIILQVMATFGINDEGLLYQKLEPFIKILLQEKALLGYRT